MNVKPLSLIDEDEDNSFQTHFSSKAKKSNKEEDSADINNKRFIISKNINNFNNSKKKNERIIFGINSQPKFLNNFSHKMKKENLFQMNINNINISKFNNTNDITAKEKISNEQQQDINISSKKEEQKEDKLSKNLLNVKKDKKKLCNGKIYFFIAILMLLYQYLSYIFLIEIPIIQSK